MPKQYRQQTDVHLIPYHEYDPSIHEIEYRYLQQPTEESFFNTPNTYNPSAADAADFYRRPVYRPRPFYPGAFFHPPVYGGYGFHPYGFPYGGYGGYGWHGYPYGGYHHGSPSFSR